MSSHNIGFCQQASKKQTRQGGALVYFLSLSSVQMTDKRGLNSIVTFCDIVRGEGGDIFQLQFVFERDEF